MYVSLHLVIHPHVLSVNKSLQFNVCHFHNGVISTIYYKYITVQTILIHHYEYLIIYIYIYIYIIIFTHIQTYIGSVVISVNPYKQLDIYGEDAMEKYRGVNFYELPPHM